MSHAERVADRELTTTGGARRAPESTMDALRPAPPTAAARTACEPLAWIPALQEIALVAVITFSYYLTRGLVRGREDAAKAHARQVLDAEQWLHIDVENWFQRLALDHAWLSMTMTITYLAAHLPVLIAVAIWLYIWHRSGYREYRNIFLATAVIGLTCYVVYPVAPPRFMLGFVDVMERNGLDLDGSGAGAFYNPYAAMPSLHVAWSALAGLVIVRHAVWVPARVFGVLLPIVMAATVLGTGNHYVLDIVAGLAVLIVAIAIVTVIRSVGEARPTMRPGHG